MREHFEVSVYILTDSMGEWWENLGRDGTTRRFITGTARLNDAKEFPTLLKALTASKQFNRFKVHKLIPPVKPAIEWGQQCVFDSATAS